MSKSFSVLRYPGGKTKAIKMLQQFVPEQASELCSPFVGGASFELFCAGTLGMKVFAYDAYEPLVNFWQCLKAHCSALSQQIHHLHPMSREEFYQYRDWLTAFDDKRNKQGVPRETMADRIKRAAIFYALNRCSFSGTTCSGGYSQDAAHRCFTLHSFAKLPVCSEVLRNVEFAHADFQDSIARHPRSLIFADPPYYLEEKSTLYGSGGNLHRHFPHQELYELLRRHPYWILTYNNCPVMRELYGAYPQVDADWMYAMSHQASGNQSKELVVLSPAVAEHAKMDAQPPRTGRSGRTRYDNNDDAGYDSNGDDNYDDEGVSD